MIKLISLFILALCKVQTVSFHKLPLAFDTCCQADSSLRRLQRFIVGFDLCSDLIARLVFSLPEKTGLKLVIGRTKRSAAAVAVWQAEHQYFYAWNCIQGRCFLAPVFTFGQKGKFEL